MNLQKSKRKISGFTLIELMVAMSIAILIMGLLIGITNSSMAAWQRGRAEVRASRHAKAMLDILAKDIEGIVIRKGNKNQWLYARSDQQTTGPQSLKSTNAAHLSFFTAATDRYDGGVGTKDDDGGDVCNVSYRLVYQDPVDGKEDTPFSTFMFYRQLANPDETFDNLLGSTDLETALSQYEGTPNYETAQNASLTNSGARYDFVCENILQYTATFRVDVTKAVGSGTNVKYEIRPIRVAVGRGAGFSGGQFHLFGDTIDTNAADISSSDVSQDELKKGTLRSIEISLTVLSDFAVEQLKIRTFKSQEEKVKFIEQHSFHFSKAVEITSL